MLTETTLLYARLANALTLRQRERTDRLMSVDAATAAMAHEIGNPLGSISMNAATALMQLQAEPPDLTDMKLVLEEIEADTHRAGSIIASVRAMFHATTDPGTIVRLDDVGRQVLGFLRDDLRRNAISVETDFRDGIPPVRAEPVQLQQVILNLVKNAVEAMISIPGNRLLRIATSVSGTSVVLSVQDSGSGISSVDQDRIFDAFYTTKAAGMGLGLSICRTLVEKNRGVLRLVRTNDDGSLFEVAIPAA